METDELSQQEKEKKERKRKKPPEMQSVKVFFKEYL